MLPWCQGFTVGVGEVVAPGDALGFSRGNVSPVDEFGGVDDFRFFDDFDDFTIANVGASTYCRIVTTVPLAPGVIAISLEILDNCSGILESSTTLQRDLVDTDLFVSFAIKSMSGLFDGFHRYVRLTAVT